MSEQPSSEALIKFIRLADGTLIDPATRKPVNVGASSREKSAPDTDDNVNDDINDDIADLGHVETDLEPIDRRSIHDIPLPTSRMAVLCVIMVYELWGVPDDEICTALNITPLVLDQLRQQRIYLAMRHDFRESVKKMYQGTVEGIMQMQSLNAAKRMVSFLNNPSGDLRMAASKDILDRSGHRPADRVEHMHRVQQDDLVIRIVDDRQDSERVSIDLDAEVIDG